LVPGVDEPFGFSLVTLTERFSEEQSHPERKSAAVVVGGESR
jgi:hypothetical protein